jgi:hypothetical protein
MSNKESKDPKGENTNGGGHLGGTKFGQAPDATMQSQSNTGGRTGREDSRTPNDRNTDFDHEQGPAQPREVGGRKSESGTTPTESAEREMGRRQDQKRDAPDSGNYVPSPNRTQN